MGSCILPSRLSPIPVTCSSRASWAKYLITLFNTKWIFLIFFLNYFGAHFKLASIVQRIPEFTGKDFFSPYFDPPSTSFSQSLLILVLRGSEVMPYLLPPCHLWFFYKLFYPPPFSPLLSVQKQLTASLSEIIPHFWSSLSALFTALLHIFLTMSYPP